MPIHRFFLCISLLAVSACEFEYRIDSRPSGESSSSEIFQITHGMKGLVPEARTVAVANMTPVRDTATGDLWAAGAHCTVSAYAIVRVVGLSAEMTRLALISNSGTGSEMCPEAVEFVIGDDQFRVMHDMHSTLMEAIEQLERQSRELYREQRPQGTVVIDSRSGERLEHSLGEDAALVLESLREPRRLADVAKEHPTIDLESTLASLVEQGLAFEDRGRAISLVLRQRTAEQHYYSTTPSKINGRVPDDGGFDSRQVRSPELVA